MRRVLISLGVMAAVLIALIIALPLIRASRLRNRLALDVEAVRARELVRASAADHPRYENGFECLRDQLAASPRHWTPFEHNESFDVVPWVRGDEPFHSLPLDVGVRMDALEESSARIRSCSSARTLRVVPGMEPWSDLEDANRHARRWRGRAPQL